MISSNRNGAARKKIVIKSAIFPRVTVEARSKSGTQTGVPIIELPGGYQENKRSYFGPVNIDRLQIQLVDDKGNNVNLNGVDWSFTIICECLYKY